MVAHKITDQYITAIFSQACFPPELVCLYVPGTVFGNENMVRVHLFIHVHFSEGHTCLIRPVLEGISNYSLFKGGCGQQ